MDTYQISSAEILRKQLLGSSQLRVMNKKLTCICMSWKDTCLRVLYLSQKKERAMFGSQFNKITYGFMGNTF